MKRWLVLFIITALLSTGLPAGTPAMAAETDALTQLQRKASILNCLGVTEQVLKAEDYARYVNKAELVGAMVDLMGNTASYGTYPAYSLEDVASDTPCADKIEFAYRYGLLSESGNFYPDINADSDAAVSMLLKILGYQDYARINGGNWITASKLGLFKDMSLSVKSNFTWQQLIALLYNAMETDLMQPSDFYAESTGYKVKTGKTILTEYFDIYPIDGVVSANAYTNLDGSEGLGDGLVQIDGMKMKSGASDVGALLGYTITGYVFKDGNEYSVLYAESGENKVCVIDVDNLLCDSVNWSANSIIYLDEKGKEKVLKLPRTVDVVYNGKTVFDYNAQTLKISDGKLTAVDNNCDGTIDVLLISETENYIVSAYDAHEKILYDKCGKKLCLDDSKTEVCIFDALKEPYDLSTLSENTILTVEVSADKSLVNGFVTRSKVSGVVKEISSEYTDGEQKVTLDKTTYTVSESWKNAVMDNKPQFQLGKRYLCYLDANDEIAMVVDKGTEDAAYGFLYEFDFDGSLDATGKFRIYTQDGVWEDYKAADKIKINGKSCDGKAAASFLVFQTTGMVVKYQINSENAITSIYTPSERNQFSQSEELISEEPVNSLRYRSDSGFFGLKYAIDGGTKIFSMQTDAEKKIDKDSITLINASSFINDKAYSMQVYDCDEFGSIGVGVITNIALEDYWDHGGILVKGLSRAIDEFGNDVLILRAVNKGKDVTYRALHDEYIEDLQTGDMIVAHVNTFGEIDQKVEYIFRHDEQFESKEKAIRGNNYANEIFVMQGFVKAKSSSCLVVDCGQTYKIPLALAKYITIYDAKASNTDKLFTTATAKDIIPGSDINSATKVLIYYRSCVPMNIILFQ